MTLREVEREALKLSQKGYSASGIAKELDVTEQTAKKYLNTIEQEIGKSALLKHKT